MPNEKGEIRREQYAAMDPPQDAPELEIPDAGEYLWQWYHQLSNSIRRIDRGVCHPIPWTEYIAWASFMSIDIRAAEKSALLAMDVAFCSEMNKELAAYHKRSAAEIEAAAARR